MSRISNLILVLLVLSLQFADNLLVLLMRILGSAQLILIGLYLLSCTFDFFHSGVNLVI